jgi:hypothetical protein
MNSWHGLCEIELPDMQESGESRPPGWCLNLCMLAVLYILLVHGSL